MRLPLTLVALVSLVAGIPPAAAESFRYVFTGSVTRIAYDEGGVLAAIGVKIGDPVSATFDVRFDTLGYSVLNDGSFEIGEDPDPRTMTNLSIRTFQANLVDASLLPVLNGGFYNGAKHAKEHHFGWYSSGPSGNQGLLLGGSDNSKIYVERSSYVESRVQSWKVGDVVRGMLSTHSDTSVGVAHADLTVQSITEIPDLPDVATQWKTDQEAERLRQVRKAAEVAYTNAKVRGIKRQVRRAKSIGNDVLQSRLDRKLRNHLELLRVLRAD